jgi:hypothetical protein
MLAPAALLESGSGLSSKGRPPKFLLVLFPGDKSGQQIQQELGTSVPVSVGFGPFPL